MRFHVVVGAYTVWLLAFFGVVYLTGGEHGETPLQLVVIGGVIPAGLQILLLGIDWRGLVAPVKMWLAFLLIVLLSYLASVTDPQLAPRSAQQLAIPAAWTPIVYSLNVTFILAIATLIAGCPDRRLLRSVVSVYCVLLTPILIYIDLTGERVWGNRLAANGVQENVWGMWGLTLCFAALARKPGLLAFVGFATGMATMFAADSRESLGAVAAGLLVVGVLDWRTMTKRSRLMAALAASSAALFMAAVLLDPYILNAIGYVKSDVLVINDPNRGFNSGWSGRSGVWAAAFDAWLKSPLLGVGYRQHEQFIPDGIPGHNAYLAMLADTGVVGFLWYVVLIAASLVASLGIRDKGTRRFVVAMIVARIVSGFFDRVTINGGNLSSLFFVICCSVALADLSLRRAASLLGGAGRSLATDLPLLASLEPVELRYSREHH